MTDREANDLLWAGLAANRGWYSMELGNWEGGRLELTAAVADRKRFLRYVTFHGWSSDLTVGCRPYIDAVGRRLYADSAAMWCKVETNAQVRALEAFNPEPSVVLREGATVRHYALWMVRSPLDADDGIRVNRHLAHKLRAPKRYAAQMWLPPAGAVMRAGRARGVPIVVAGGSGELYSVGAVCRTLPRTIPSPDAWRERAA